MSTTGFRNESRAGGRSTPAGRNFPANAPSNIPVPSPGPATPSASESASAVSDSRRRQSKRDEVREKNETPPSQIPNLQRVCAAHDDSRADSLEIL